MRWGGSALALLLCCARPVSTPDAGATQVPRAALRLALPEGWIGQEAPDGSLRVGPAGRPLLRIDRLPGSGPALPTPEGLRSAFLAGLRGLAVRGQATSRAEGFSAVRLTLVPAGPSDAGSPVESVALLAAKRVAETLYLCATSPGATDAELDAASRICGGLAAP